MDVAKAGKRVPTEMFTLITRLVATRAVYRMSSPSSTVRDTESCSSAESARMWGVAISASVRWDRGGKPRARTRGVSRKSRPREATYPRCSRVIRARRAVARARPVACGDAGQVQLGPPGSEGGQHGEAAGQRLDEVPAEPLLGLGGPRGVRSRRVRSRRRGGVRDGPAQRLLHVRDGVPQPPQHRLAQRYGGVPAGVADDADHARDVTFGAAHGHGERDEAGLDELVVEGPAGGPGARHALLERLLLRLLTGRHRGERAVLGIRGPARPPPLPQVLVPRTREERARRGAFGGQQVADAEAQRHGAAPGRLVDEADPVRVGDRERDRFVELVREPLGARAEQRGQPQSAQIGVAHGHQRWRECGVTPVEAQAPHVREGRADPVDRGPGETGGPRELAQAQRAACVGEHAQHVDAAHQRCDGLRGRRDAGVEGGNRSSGHVR